MSCIYDTELKYKYISLEVNERVCTHFTLENWFNIFLITFALH